ncbi:hypothetical protein B0H19DRAFT_224266 [Mycena capillaripes]|nr:hypothetical protein B0H19DRAFT_224266 [Mycena capillaripes]
MFSETFNPNPPIRITASTWAATEDGRAEFQNQFRILYSKPQYVDNGDPAQNLLSCRSPPAKWAKAKMEDLLKVVGNSEAYAATPRLSARKVALLRGLQSQFIGFLRTSSLKDDGDEDKEERNTTERVESKDGQELEDYDAVDGKLTDLELIAVDVLRLRALPYLPSTETWSTVIDKLIDLAIEPYEWALEYPQLVQAFPLHRHTNHLPQWSTSPAGHASGIF